MFPLNNSASLEFVDVDASQFQVNKTNNTGEI